MCDINLYSLSDGFAQHDTPAPLKECDCGALVKKLHDCALCGELWCETCLEGARDPFTEDWHGNVCQPCRDKLWQQHRDNLLAGRFATIVRRLQEKPPLTPREQEIVRDFQVWDEVTRSTEDLDALRQAGAARLPQTALPPGEL